MDKAKRRAGIDVNDDGDNKKDRKSKNEKRKPDKRDLFKRMNPRSIDTVIDNIERNNSGFLTNDKAAGKLWDHLKDEVRYADNEKDQKGWQFTMDVGYIKRLENATHFSRGTKTEELDNMLKGGMLGHGSRNPNYTYLTTSEKTAESFAFKCATDGGNSYLDDGIETKEDRHVPVLISIPKDRILDSIVSPGYTTDYDSRGKNESDIYEPQGYRFLGEEEHRIRPDIVPISNLGNMDITIYTKDPERRRRFRAKYKKLGTISFV